MKESHLLMGGATSFNNINLKANKPVWGKECTHCMACICKCPKGAIEYGEKSIGRIRYKCPM